MTRHIPLRRHLWPGMGLVAFVTGLFVAWVLLKPAPHDRFVTVDNLAQLLGMLLGVALCVPPGAPRQWLARRRDRPRLAHTPTGNGPHPWRWSPVLLALAILCQAMGQATYTYYEDVRHQTILFPSWADASFLAVYPFALGGILLLSRRTLSLAARARVILDGLLIMSALVTFSWYFVLGPTVLQAGQTPFGTAVGAAYPLGDLLLMVCLLLLTARASNGHLRPVIGILAVALTSIVLTDSVYDYQLLHSGYATGSLLDVGWAFGYSMIGLGVRALRYADRADDAPSLDPARETTPTAPAVWRALLPYAVIPAVAALVVYVWRTHGTALLDQGVYLGGALLIVLVLTRQVVAIREVVAANRALRTMYTNNAALTAANTQLEILATTDALTGLPNRSRLHAHLGQALTATGSAATTVALLLMDLDRFKEVNDTLGHHYGDLLLCKIGPRGQKALRATDTVARLGGDEFAVVLPSADAQGASGVAQAIRRALEAPFLLEGHAVDVGVSIGVALHPAHGEDSATLLRCADIAMYVAKGAHTGVACYDPAQDGYSTHRLTLMSDLRQAIATDTLALYYQPKVECGDGGVVGVEALLRWSHPDLGSIPPDQFIPLAEHTGQIAPLTEWVLHTALRQGQAWAQRGIVLDIAVNLSARTLHDIRLPDLIADLLRQYDYTPAYLTLEITESALMIDPTRALDVLTRLAALGVHLAIDDFGTGYSSLGYLKRLPVDEVKIDKSFVLEMTGNAKDAALVRSIVAMAHALNLSVVAEGVETREAWDLLRVLGCDVTQGYYLSRPIPAPELERWIDERSSREGSAARQRPSPRLAGA